MNRSNTNGKGVNLRLVMTIKPPDLLVGIWLEVEGEEEALGVKPPEQSGIVHHVMLHKKAGGWVKR